MTEYGFPFFERLEDEGRHAHYQNTGYLFHKENEAAGGCVEEKDYTAEIAPEDARRVIRLLEAKRWDDELMLEYIRMLPGKYRVWYSGSARSFITLFDPEAFPKPDNIAEDWKDTEAELSLIVKLFETPSIERCPCETLRMATRLMRQALEEIRAITGRDEA